MKLKCSNTKCESHETNALFNINVSVDEDRDIADNLKKVEPEYFVCSHCGSEATQTALARPGWDGDCRGLPEPRKIPKSDKPGFKHD